MPNASKVNDPRFEKNWLAAGAIGYPMNKGVVLNEPDNIRKTWYVQSWLNTWRKNPLNAIDQLVLVHHRDSYPGHWVTWLFHEGQKIIIPPVQFEKAVLQWLRDVELPIAKIQQARPVYVLMEIFFGVSWPHSSYDFPRIHRCYKRHRKDFQWLSKTLDDAQLREHILYIMQVMDRSLLEKKKKK